MNATTRRPAPMPDAFPPAAPAHQAARRKPSAAPLVPSAPDAERSLIGALLLEGATPGTVDDCARMVEPASFLQPAWACAWRSIWKRAGAGDAIDPVLVAEDCEADPEWPGGAAALSLLIGATGGAVLSSHAPWYARQVFAAAHRRRVIETASRVAAEAYQHAGEPEELQASVSKAWAALDIMLAETETGALGPVFDSLEAQARAGLPLGQPTGMRCLDEWIGGCVPGHIWILGGYSNVGKSMLACALANGLADHGVRVAVVSLEMTAAQMAVRLLAGRVGASAAFRYQVKPGRPPATWNDAERIAVEDARDVIEEYIHVYQSVRTLEGVQSVARRGGYDVVIVDYGQLLEVSGARSEYEGNTAAARGLQALAKRAECTVIALSQLSQEHQRLGRDDAVFGFKGSGAWSEVADLGLMLTRDKATPEVLDLAAVKNRHGLNAAAGAKAQFRVDKSTGALTEIVPHQPPPARQPYANGEPVVPWSDRAERVADDAQW